MKILHTSDWHLGHVLYNYDRTEEHQAMLSQMQAIVEKEKPDLFLLCGDVYNLSQPSAAAQTMFSNALVKIHQANPDMTIVVTAGNHDSPARHDVFQTPWLALNVHTVGNLNSDNPGSHIIEVPGKGYVVAIPYCHERNLPDGIFQQLLDRTAELNTGNLPVVMSAHTTVSGCDITGHSNITERHVGGIDSLSVEQMGTGYDYLALGHIHKSQFIHTGKHNVRYSGTPVAVSFDEAYSHSVSMVEIDAHNTTPRVTEIEITNPRPLVTLPATGYVCWEEALNLLSNYPGDISAYIRLNVTTESFLPAEAHYIAEQAIEGKKCMLCQINVKREKQTTDNTPAYTIQELQEEKPLEIARRYAAYKNITFTTEMEELFNQVIDIVNQKDRNN